jgi:hypothetical protein
MGDIQQMTALHMTANSRNTSAHSFSKANVKLLPSVVSGFNATLRTNDESKLFDISAHALILYRKEALVQQLGRLGHRLCVDNNLGSAKRRDGAH